MATAHRLWRVLENVSGARQSWGVVGSRILIVLVFTLSLASTILRAKSGPPEDMGCGLDSLWSSDPLSNS